MVWNKLLACYDLCFWQFYTCNTRLQYIMCIPFHKKKKKISVLSFTSVINVMGYHSLQNEYKSNVNNSYFFGESQKKTTIWFWNIIRNIFNFYFFNTVWNINWRCKTKCLPYCSLGRVLKHIPDAGANSFALWNYFIRNSKFPNLFFLCSDQFHFVIRDCYLTDNPSWIL